MSKVADIQDKSFYVTANSSQNPEKCRFAAAIKIENKDLRDNVLANLAKEKAIAASIRIILIIAQLYR